MIQKIQATRIKNFRFYIIYVEMSNTKNINLLREKTVNEVIFRH